MRLQVTNADPLALTADAVAVQYPQRLHGLVDRVVRAFLVAKRPILLPQPGAARLLDTVPGVVPARVLILGVAQWQKYDYGDLRAFSYTAISRLSAVTGVAHVVLPTYGPPGYRLDDAKAFEVEIAGVLDAMRSTAADALTRITVAERDTDRAARLSMLLPDLLTRLNQTEESDASGQTILTKQLDEPAAHDDDFDATTPRLFLCYRRDDASDSAGRLVDKLVDAYGSDRVFMDIDSVPLGIDFVEHVSEQISRCAVVIVMIGKQWLKIKDKRRRRRLDNEDDLVRAEIRAALQQKVPVIPVVVQDADMPSAEELPEDIRPLARRNGIYLRPEQWRAGVARLLKELDKVMKP
jgi:TIR domain